MFLFIIITIGRDGLMVQGVGLQIERSGFEPWRRHCIVFLGKTLSQTEPLSRPPWSKTGYVPVIVGATRQNAEE